MHFITLSKIIPNKILLPGILILFLSVISYAVLPDDSSANKDENPLYVDPFSQDFSQNPGLLKRIESGPHGYYRFINIPFSQAVCRRFEGMISGSPSLNLHGDAHLEQYAVTDLGRGLTDFDDSSTGPGIIDLMRFGVSLHLACRVNNWQDKSEELMKIFLQGYSNALNDPGVTAPEPQVVKRIRSKFTINREKYFQWIASLMEPMPQTEKDSLMNALTSYISTQLAEVPELPKEYFRAKEMGYLKMGIGSALDRKYLLRVEGRSSDPLDDVVLECKQVRDLSGIDCVNSGSKGDPFRILLGQSRIAYQPFHHLGYFRFKKLMFWVHSWVDNYKEVKIGKSFHSPEELAEVAFDVGVQLGKGHIKHIAAPLDLQIRREQLHLVNSFQSEILSACDELADQTVSAWANFCSAIDTKTEHQKKK